MALDDLLLLSKKETQKKEISEERLRAALPELAKAFSFYREYPDKFLDFLVGEENPTNFNLYFYQRVFLRAVIRHKYAYATFPRAYSKSFLSVGILMLRCVLFPGAKLFITTGGKEQAAGIAKEKVDEWCMLVPALHKEIDWRPGKTIAAKDMVRYQFKNSSILDIIAASERSRGKRKTGGLMEEVNKIALIYLFPFINGGCAIA